MFIENHEYKIKIKELVEEINGRNTDAIQKWEDFKVKVRKFSIIFSKKHQCNLKSKIKFIETQINKNEESDCNEMDMNKKRVLEAELCELYDKNVKVLKFVRGPDGCVKVKRIQNIFFLGPKSVRNRCVNRFNHTSWMTCYSN